MKPLVGQPVFRVGDEQYFWEDALIAGVLRGDWDALERETREGVACLHLVEAGRAILPESEVNAAAADFRYARDLVSAQDTIAWLDRWGLSRDEWMGCIRRSVARRHWASELPRIVESHRPEARDVSEAMQPDALCTGRLRTMAEALARRAAAWDQLRSTGDAPSDEAEFEAERQRIPGDLASRGITALSDERLADRAATVARLGVGLRRFRELVVTPRAVEAQIARRKLDWILFRCRVAAFANEPAAREAALCLREDGMDIGEVAAAARAPMHESSGFLDMVPRDLRERLLAAGEGDIVGPVPQEGSFALLRVDAKYIPSADDPQVRRRAEREVLERALTRAAHERAKWQVRPM